MLHFGATGRWTRPNSCRALESKQGCLHRSRAMLTSYIHVAVWVAVLDCSDPCVGNSVQQIVRASIPQMKNAVGPDPIVDREADRILHLGYRGANDLLDRITNTRIATPDEE